MSRMNHHDRAAFFAIERANERSKRKNRRNTEAKAEMRKVRELPRPDATKPFDDTPRVILSPRSSWASINGAIGINEYMPDGFKFSDRPQ